MCVCISLVCLASKCMTAHLLTHQFIPGDNCVKSAKSVKLVISVKGQFVCFSVEKMEILSLS